MNQRGANRVSTGVTGLDQMLNGGVFPGDAVLVAGSPGTGKTTLGLHFLAAGVAAGEPGVLITFEYLPQQIYRDAEAKGWPLREWEEEGKVRVICTTPDVLLAGTRDEWSLLDEAIRDLGAKRLVLDSITFFDFHQPEGHKLRQDVSGLMNHLRLLDVTTLITHEIPQIVGPTVTLSKWGIEFLSDDVIMLRYVELEGELKMAINILKFRGGAHDRRYRFLKLTDKGMVVEAPFEGVENISAGAARRNLRERAGELI